MEESYRNPKKRVRVIKEDPDTIKVRLNRLIRLTEIVIYLLILGCAIIFGIFIRILLM